MPKPKAKGLALTLFFKLPHTALSSKPLLTSLTFRPPAQKGPKKNGSASSKATGSSLVATFPANVLHSIFLAGLSSPAQLDSPNPDLASVKLNSAFLLSIALVCRSWQSQTPSLLYRDIELKGEKQAKLLLRSKGFGTVETKRLRLLSKWSKGDLTLATARKVLARVMGLKELAAFELGGGSDAYHDLLQLDNLSGVTTLVLSKLRFGVQQPPISPSTFSPSTLILRDYKSKSPSPFTFFPPTSITSLELTNILLLVMSNLPDFTLFLNLFAPQLKSLKIHESGSSQDTNLCYIPFVNSLSSSFMELKSLSFGGKHIGPKYFGEFLEGLPGGGLEELVVGVDGVNVRKVLEDMTGFECLMELKKVRVEAFEDRKGLVKASGEIEIEEWERRGVEISYGMKD